MTIRTTLLGLAITSLALVAAAPASAISRSYEATMEEPPLIERVVHQTNQPPVDENGKKSCEYRKWDGSPGYYPHGTVITLKLPNGTEKSAKCNDGTWEEAMTQAEAAGYHLGAYEAYLTP
jgi:hypothetical protein